MQIVVRLSKSKVARFLFLAPNAGGGDVNNWVIMSSDRADVNPEQRDWHRDMFRNLLKNEGLAYMYVTGYYGGTQEESLLIFGLSAEEAMRYASLFNQDSFVSRSGVYVRQDNGSYEPSPITNRVVMDDDTGFEAWDRSVIRCYDGTITYMVSVG